MFNAFGNKVKIKSTSETDELNLANKIGEAYGQTTPSMMDLEIIGTLTEDVAYNVYFEELDESFWFAEDLIEHLDNGEGAVITLNGVDKKWTKGENGDWIEEDTSSKHRWWEFWK